MKNNTHLWLISKDLPMQEISKEEEYISTLFGLKKSLQFKHSRGYIRKVLAKLFKIDPMEVPLKTTFRKPPELEKNFGYLSISHCEDITLIGWSNRKIGVDIEPKDRDILSKKIAQRFFNPDENIFLKNFNDKEYDYQVLKRWVIKESLVKWQRGKIAFDLQKWFLNEDLNKAKHSDLLLEVNVFFIKYKKWLISIASRDKLIENKNLSIIN